TDIDGLTQNVPECNDLFYPYTAGTPQNPATPLTATPFPESDVLRAASTDLTDGIFKLWYNDEHALALGVRQVSTLFKGTPTKNSNSVSVNTTAGLFPGNSVSGNGIPAGTTIATVGPGNFITLSAQASAGALVTLTAVAPYTVSPLPTNPGSVTN